MGKKKVDVCGWCGQVGQGTDTMVSVILPGESRTGRAQIIVACGPEHHNLLLAAHVLAP